MFAQITIVENLVIYFSG